ncbi:MAG: hypothetical protein ACYS76_05145 [Planctomycetota bacterium]|jgi:hypothetical protein
MKLVQIVPVEDDKPTLKTLLKETERHLRGRGTTFKRQREGRWHARYPGWINWDSTKGGMIVAEVQSKRPDSEWQLLQAFIGYVGRHIGRYVQSINIIYR